MPLLQQQTKRSNKHPSSGFTIRTEFTGVLKAKLLDTE